MPQTLIQRSLKALGARLLGKSDKLEYALACLLAGGHLLIEDVPGVGKTTLAKSLASCFDVAFKRIQFTSDLLPSDLIGVTIYRQKEERFEFNRGPIFTNVLLADEVNRANPKTQSALLEAMHEGQISHDNETFQLPRPFFVIATQNSKDHHGTFPLPESQLDRFLMRLRLGYPEAEDEKSVIKGEYESSDQMIHVSHVDDLMQLQGISNDVAVADEVLDYIYQIVDATRRHENIRVGVSPRGGQAMYRAVKALALVRGRTFVVPDDVRELAPLIFGHRILAKNTLGTLDDEPSRALFESILDALPSPV
ncbi:MAG: MoxR family ATPase [Acidobacteria bacterium]|nr:MoxR family ATPase [Acidobacteriota bacterium]